MLIPKGKSVYENLATSYVLVDSLVDDLCEGGFSGVVELTLRETDAYIIIEGGNVVAVIEQRGEDAYLRRTVAELAARSRRERGRISVFRYAPGIGSSIARRLAAKPLYTQLSTEFADLGKMIAKLGRERDRHWFIEVSITDGDRVLVHVVEDRYEVISSGGPANEDEAGTRNNESALRELLHECEHAGGTFDVYFVSATEEPAPEPAAPEDAQYESATPALGPSTEEFQPAPAVSLESNSLQATVDEEQEERTRVEADSRAAAATSAGTDRVLSASAIPERASSSGAESVESADSDEPPSRTPRTEELSLAALASSLEGSSEAAVMAEVKRLMGEIARTIEESTRAVEQRDCFSMYLRAGQLKIADEYTFLDPFGAEFEYLGGEIAFIGEAKPADFIRGLTDAMRLAVIGVAESSAQPTRFRACIIRDLRQLLERQRQEMEKFGLDHSIEQIVAA